tara:strand:- start:604 stop:1200 length:597 start_codon:yes stop_codon:yes gene_type:complete
MASKFFFKGFSKVFKGPQHGGRVATIGGVKPTTDISGSIKRVKQNVASKRISDVSKVKDKMKTGKKMMKEAQMERKKLVDTGRAFQFKRSQDFHSIRPGENPKVKYKGLIKEDKPKKKFKKGKELAAGGRVGLKAGTNPFKKKTNVDKIKETFGPKKRINAKGGFPDLSGDGKTTFKDILIGRGVIKKKNGKTKKKVI